MTQILRIGKLLSILGCAAPFTSAFVPIIHQRRFRFTTSTSLTTSTPKGSKEWHLEETTMLFKRDKSVGTPTVVATVPTKRGASLALSGKLFSTLKKFYITPDKAQKVVNAVSNSFQPGDLLLISIFGWCLVPLTRLVVKAKYLGTEGDFEESRFVKSKTYKVVKGMSEVAQIGGLVYLADMLTLVFKALNLNYFSQIHASTLVAQSAYTIWFAFKLSEIKRFFVRRFFKRHTQPNSNAQGKASVYDKIIDVVIFGVASLMVLDFLPMETGRAVGSLFALGGVGTVVFSLASKDLAAQFLSGLALSTSGKFYEGEEVRLGDSTAGIVNHIGWLFTEIRGFDEIIMKIPNTQLANQRVSNVSRIKKCQVKQSIFFEYEDIDKIPKIIEDIKREIMRACGEFLIQDGTRPFYVHWREFRAENLELVVDTHFVIPASGKIYWDNREKVLFAIAKAAKANDAKFAIPQVRVKGQDGGDVAAELSRKAAMEMSLRSSG